MDPSQIAPCGRLRAFDAGPFTRAGESRETVAVLIRLSSVAERVRASLFVLPTTAVLIAIAIAVLTINIDSTYDSATTDLPLGFASTVESARTSLSTIAGATIAFAGVAFSVSLLVIQLASSQYSPRVIHTLFRDPFNKRVMATVVGTFTYCLIVLRAVRSPLEEGGDPVIPNLSVALAVALGIVAILTVVAFIDHNAHAMDISEILERVKREAITQISKEWEPSDSQLQSPIVLSTTPDAPTTVVRFHDSGWVQQIDTHALARCPPDGATITVLTGAGRYAVEGTPLCTISPPVRDIGSIEKEIRAAIVIGSTRTMQQDASFGLRQLADVALRALSPGVNDPTTAQDAIFHSTAVLAELHRRTPPSASRPRPGGGMLVMAHPQSHDDLVRLAFDEVRQAAAPHPAVSIYLLEALHLLREAAEAAEPGRAHDGIAEQARLVVLGCEAAGPLPVDLQRVQRAYRARFGTGRADTSGPGPG
jgi:uncharacterized membrane protein